MAPPLLMLAAGWHVWFFSLYLSRTWNGAWTFPSVLRSIKASVVGLWLRAWLREPFTTYRIQALSAFVMDDQANSSCQSLAKSLCSTFQRKATPEPSCSSDIGTLLPSELSRCNSHTNTLSPSKLLSSSSDIVTLSPSELSRSSFDRGTLSGHLVAERKAWERKFAEERNLREARPKSPGSTFQRKVVTPESSCSSDKSTLSPSEWSREDSPSRSYCRSTWMPCWMREDQLDPQLMIDELKEHFDEELSIQRSALEGERKLREDQFAAERIAREREFAEQTKVRDAELTAAKKAIEAATYRLNLAILSIGAVLTLFVVLLLVIFSVLAEIF